MPIWSFKVLEELTYAIPQTISHNNATEKSNPLSTNKLPPLPSKVSFAGKHQSIMPGKCYLGASETCTSDGCNQTLNTEYQHPFGNKKLLRTDYQTKH